uniref:Zinc finger protein with KRAB and SCAN domains 4-like n=1 Tax=Astyanax mexicanus TaxID=7994 RepID=W5KJ82_ASTMX
MASMQSLSVFVTERLTLAAQEIFKAVEVTVSEYHQEISRSRQENELLKRRLLEAGIDLYTELQPNMPSMPIMHDGDGDAGQGPPACGEQWGQTSEEIQVKLELSAAQEQLQDAPSQIAVANEPVSPKPCLQSEQKMEDMFQSQTAETSMDNLLLAGPYIQVKQEPNELVSNLGPQTLCDVQSCIPSYPNNAAAASGHTSGLGGEMDSQRMSSLHKPGRSKWWEITLPSQTAAITETTLTLIKTTLPPLSEELLQLLMQRLDALGVCSVEDLRRVTAADLEGLLQPAQCGTLIEVFNTASSENELAHSTAGPIEPPAGASGKFQIPWEKFPPELVKAMVEKTRPHPSLRREMVRIIIDDFFSAKMKRPGRDTIRQISHELVLKYPNSFCDLYGEDAFGTGFKSLMDQMENRVENCWRSGKRKSKRPAESDAGAEKPKRFVHYGCVQWEPDLPANEDGQSQTGKRAELQNSYTVKNLPEADIKKLMAETYYSQRISINHNNKTISELKEKWPYLFEATYLFEHSERLLGIPVQKRLAEELAKKGKTIMNFLAQAKVTPGNFQGPLELLFSIGNYLGDKTELLLIRIEGHNFTAQSLQRTPCVLVLDDEHYLMAVDQTIVNGHISCPLTALTYLICLFYTLNIQFPKDAALALDYVMRCLLGISPKRGPKMSRKEKKQLKIHPKLMKFLSELSDYQNP